MLRDDKERTQLIEFLSNEFKDQNMIESSSVEANSDKDKMLTQAIVRGYTVQVWKIMADRSDNSCVYKLTPTGQQAIDDYLSIYKVIDCKDNDECENK